MADIKISDMTVASSVADADVVPIVQGGANKKSAFSVIKTYVQTAFNAIYVPLTRTLTIGGNAQDLSTDRSWTTATILEGLGTPAQGDIIYRGASQYVLLAPGTSGYVLTTHGASANPTWTASSGATAFIGLSDVPGSYSGQTLKAVRVNAGETALEFYTPAASTQIGGVTFGLKRTSGIATGKLGGYWTCPYAGNITAWNLTVDAGTVTIKVWKKAAGTAHPTSSDSINTSGLALSTGTHLRSTTLSDFTSTAVTAGDTFAIEVTAVSGVADLGGSIEITH